MTIVLICYKMEKSKLQKADIMFFNTYVHTLKKKNKTLEEKTNKSLEEYVKMFTVLIYAVVLFPSFPFSPLCIVLSDFLQ